MKNTLKSAVDQIAI